MNHDLIKAISDDAFRARDIVTHGVMVTTAAPALKIVYVNAGFERVSGHRSIDLVGRSPLALFAPCAETQESSELRTAIDTGAPATLIVRMRRQDGGLLWCAIDLSPIRNDNGDIVHLLWSWLNLTELQSLRARLLQAENMEALDQVAGGVAHDVNNVLGAIRSFGALLAEEISPRSTHQRFASRIVSACDRAAEMVRQLLSFSGAKAAARQHVSVAALLNDVGSLVRGRMPSTVALSVNNFARNPTILANESQITQVLLNLAINGLEAMVAGGVLAISVFEFVMPETAGHTLEGSSNLHVGSHICASGALKPGTAYVKISVSDTGTGIPKEIAENIFQPFFTTKDKRRGTGLGLAIVKRIVLAHDGVIAVQSQDGIGSTFHIYLPALTDPAQGAEAQTRDFGFDTVSGDERIMIVDDEVDLADAFSIALDRLGYRTQAVYSPLAALDLFTKDPCLWDVVVTDQSMPRMDGLRLIRKMKFIRPDIRAILCSGSADAAMKGRPDEADAVLAKPLPVERLAASIRRLRDRVYSRA